MLSLKMRRGPQSSWAVKATDSKALAPRQLRAYAKNVQTDMTPDEKRAVTALAAALKATWKEKK
jgi:hypothetical protein